MLNKLLGNGLSRDSFVVFTCRIIGVLIYFLFSIYVSNKFGASVFGEFILFILYLNLLSLIAGLGLDQYVLQQFPSLIKEKNLSGLKKISLFSENILLASIVISAMICVLFYYLFSNAFSENRITLLIALCIGPFVVFRYRLEGIRASKKMLHYGIAAYIVIPLSALIFIFLFNTRLDTLSPFVAYAFGILIAAILSQIWWKSILQSIDWKSLTNKFSALESVLKKSLPLMLVTALMFLHEWMDKLMLGTMTTSHDLGLYGAAFRIVQFFALPLIAINAVIAPNISEQFILDKSEMLRTIRTGVSLIMISSIPLAIIMFAFPKFLLGLFGGEFIEAKMVLLILLTGQMVNVFAGPVGIILKMTKFQNALLKIVVIATILNFILNLIWIPSMGIEGAALATAVSIILMNLLSIIFIKRQLGFFSFIPGWNDIK